MLNLLHSLLLLCSLPYASAAASPHCALRPRLGKPAPASSQLPLPAPGPVAAAWFAGWQNSYFPPEQLSWSKYTLVHYAFAVTTSDGSILALPAGEEPILQHFVQVAHQNNVKASLSIGGWSGSRFFSSAVATAQSRTALVAAVIGFVNKYKLDGIDIDWEYPDKEGMCNQFSPQDSANLLSFLAQLRKDPVGSRLTITAAVSTTPFTGPSGDPMSDVSQFAKVLDYIAIMDYDVWGRWTRPALVGPNAPLDDACDNQHARQGSAASAVAAWTAAGFPARKIILAVAAYGHSFHVDPAAAYPNGDTTLAAYPPFDPAQQPKGDSRDALSPGGIGPCGTSEPSGYSGVFSFAGLIEDGFLRDNGVNADGIGYRFDDCSQTPYVYKRDTQVMVSFDDGRSFVAKGKFIKSHGMGGFAMWLASGDHNDILVNSIRKALS